MNDRRQTDPGYTPEPNTLVIEDQSLRYGFVQLPKQLLWAKNISRDAKMLYAVLLGYAWQEDSCYPGYPRLCDDMGASENMVRKYMRELEAVGLLRQKRRGQGRTNLYTLPDIRTAKIEVQEPHRSRPAKTAGQEPLFSTPPDHKKTEGKVETVEQEPDQYLSNIRKTKVHQKLARDTDATANETPVAEDPASEARAAVRAKLARVRKGRSTERGFSRPGDLLADAAPEQPEGQPANGRAHSRDRERQVLVSYMTDLARELGDNAKLSSTVTRAQNLMERSGVDLDTFIASLMQSKSMTQEKTAAITSLGDRTDPWGQPRKTKMPYFFGVLEDVLGLKPAGPNNGRPQTRKTG